MDEQQLLSLKPERDRFLERFAPLFGTPQNQVHARCFVQGLLHKGERRNSENIAEAIQGCHVRNLQAFITTGVWQDTEILSLIRQSVLEVLGDEDSVWNSDETGFPKKGTKSVGVKRQYSGTLGRTDNCQVGVFANYCSAKGHTFMDRRLFLPEDWADDSERRQEAGVPEGVIFRTKPELALEMLTNAAREGIPFRWVGGDSVYGDSPTFVQGTRQLEKWYVLDTSSGTHVWTEEPQVLSPEQRPKPKRGRPPTQPLVVGQKKRVDEVIAALPNKAWRRVTIGPGSQGPRVYEYAEVDVWFSEEGMPSPKERLLVRRSLSQEPELKYHRRGASGLRNGVSPSAATVWLLKKSSPSRADNATAPKPPPVSHRNCRRVRPQKLRCIECPLVGCLLEASFSLEFVMRNCSKIFTVWKEKSDPLAGYLDDVALPACLWNTPRRRPADSMVNTANPTTNYHKRGVQVDEVLPRVGVVRVLQTDQQALLR